MIDMLFLYWQMQLLQETHKKSQFIQNISSWFLNFDLYILNNNKKSGSTKCVLCVSVLCNNIK